jgi:VanZ family protein
MKLAYLYSWLPVSFWVGLIYYLSSVPHLDSGWGLWDFILRKIAHMVEYAVLTFLLVRAMNRTWPETARRHVMLWGGALSILYAMSDEFHQSFVPGRGPSFHDVLIDGIGVALLLLFVHKRKLRPC